MDDLSRFCCQNSECPDYGKPGGENLSVCDHYGPNKQRRLLRCRTCKARFSERKGTPLFGSTLPEEKALSLLQHIGEGCKDWDIHDAVTYLTMYPYNFCWPVRTLRQRGPDNRWLPQTPALAAGLTDHVWSLRERLTFPAVQQEVGHKEKSHLRRMDWSGLCPLCPPSVLPASRLESWARRR